MACLAARLSEPRFGSCLAASRAAAALVIFAWKLFADAVLGRAPSRNAPIVSPMSAVRRRGVVAQLKVELIEFHSFVPEVGGFSVGRVRPLNLSTTRRATQ